MTPLVIPPNKIPLGRFSRVFEAHHWRILIKIKDLVFLEGPNKTAPIDHERRSIPSSDPGIHEV
jgi:hypothetical protein